VIKTNNTSMTGMEPRLFRPWLLN